MRKGPAHPLRSALLLKAIYSVEGAWECLGGKSITALF